MKLHILKRNQSFWSLGCSLPSFYCGCYCFQSILSFWCILEQEGKRLIFVDSKLHFSRSVISLKTADGWGMLQGILREKYWTVMECELSTVSKLYLLGLLLTKWISWISTWNSISSYSVKCRGSVQWAVCYWGVPCKQCVSKDAFRNNVRATFHYVNKITVNNVKSKYFLTYSIFWRMTFFYLLFLFKPIFTHRRVKDCKQFT